MVVPYPGTVYDYLWSHVFPEPTSGCWLWDAALNEDGYGRANRSNRTSQAHRMMFFAVHPEADQSLQVLHRCDQPSCIDPDHLFLGTPTDNMRDAARKGRLSQRPQCYGGSLR